MAELTRKFLARPVPLVLVTIVLQLAAAWLLAGVANKPRVAVLLAAAAIAVAIALNLGRFLLWRIIHQRFPLSHSYPLTSLFFPCILVISYLRGDPIGPAQVAGTCLITIGALALSSPGRAGGMKA